MDGADDGAPRTAAGDTGGRGLRVGSLALAAVFALPLLFLVQQSWTLGAPVVEALTDPSNLAPLWRSLVLGASVALTTSVQHCQAPEVPDACVLGDVHSCNASNRGCHNQWPGYQDRSFTSIVPLRTTKS